MLSQTDRSFYDCFRGVLPRKQMTDIFHYFNAIEQERQAAVSSVRERTRVEMGATTDALRFDQAWYKPWAALPAETIEQFSPFQWLLYPVQIRHMYEESHLVPWHQDIAYARLLGDRGHRQLITCFTPFDLEPAKTATLEFAKLPDGQPHWPYLEHGPQSFHGACLEDSLFGERERYELELGDMLVFADHCPHQGVAGPNGMLDRRSFEFRLIIPEDRLPDKDYFDIKTGRFLRTDAQREVTYQ